MKKWFLLLLILTSLLFGVLLRRLSPAVPTPLSSLYDQVWWLRFGYNQVILQALTEALQDKSVEVRSYAVCALSSQGPQAVLFITQALQDRDASVREMAAHALCRIVPNKSAVSALIQTLQDTDANVRRVAASALHCAGVLARPAIPHLIPLLSDEDSRAREAAARALRAISEQDFGDDPADWLAWQQTQH